MPGAGQTAKASGVASKAVPGVVRVALGKVGANKVAGVALKIGAAAAARAAFTAAPPMMKFVAIPVALVGIYG